MPWIPALLPYMLMAAGTTAQVMSQQQKQKSDAALAKYNIDMKKQAADRQRSAGAEAQRLKRMEMRKALSRNREITASSGFMMEGTPAMQQLELIDNYGYDISRIGYESEGQARGFDMQAELYKMKAKSAQRASKMGQWSSAIGGASDMYDYHNRWKEDEV